MPKKTFIIDTNVLLHDPKALSKFQENDVILPLVVIEELDSKKRRQDEIGRNAREVNRYLDSLRSRGRLSEGVKQDNGGNLKIEINHVDRADNFPKVLKLESADNRILSMAHYLNSKISGGVIIVSKDMNFRIKADSIGIRAEDYKNDKTYNSSSGLYTGQATVTVDEELIKELYNNKFVQDDIFNKFMPNQFLTLVNRNNPKNTGIAIHTNKGKIEILRYSDANIFGIYALNREQKFALELLMRDEIKIVSIAGKAGTGKTLLAIAAGLELTAEKQKFGRLAVMRSAVPMENNDIGFLPGNIEEKMDPWAQPIYDNLDYLFRDSENGKGSKGENIKNWKYLIDGGILSVAAMSYLRGRSLPNTWLLVDECQNLTPHGVKTTVTRVGEKSKIVLVGDVCQIDHPYLDEISNGLSYLCERLKEESITGHITLQKGERSEVSELGANLL
jgi:PhoH-like ATPase